MGCCLNGRALWNVNNLLTKEWKCVMVACAIVTSLPLQVTSSQALVFKKEDYSSTTTWANLGLFVGSIK